jgi:rhodanese-related sulfurtransferase
MGILDFLFGNQKEKIQDYLEKDAVILDVRTKQEWNAGHIKKAIHIPLDQLHNRTNEVAKHNKPIIVYCASGVRSGKAAKYLNLNNIDAINGGGLNSLSALIK